MAQLTVNKSSRLLEGLAELYALAPLEEFPKRVLALVHHLIGCDAASYNEIEVTTGHFRALIDPDDALFDTHSSGFERYIHQHPVISYVDSTGDARPHTISDFLRPHEFHRLDLYGEFFGPLGFDDQLSTTLQAAQGERILGVALNRSGGFSEGERLLLDALRPHLVIAHQNALQYSSVLAGHSNDELLPTPAVSALARLTDRQCEILRLISSGSTNAQVACELDISVGTVKKHVEHILERLHVQSRVGAARIYLAGPSSRRQGSGGTSLATVIDNLWCPQSRVYQLQRRERERFR